MRIYPWLIWYIWKARNDKLYSATDRQPPNIVNLAMAEANAWATAQVQEEALSWRSAMAGSDIQDRLERCQVDGAWKLTESRAGLGWFYSNATTGEKLIGASNLRRGLSSLETELEALVWAMQSMLQHNKRMVYFETDCSDVVKMVASPEEWPAFSILLEEIDKCKKEFSFCSITHIPRTKNTKADKLARSARDLPYNVYYINSTPPVWTPRPV